MAMTGVVSSCSLDEEGVVCVNLNSDFKFTQVIIYENINHFQALHNAPCKVSVIYVGDTVGEFLKNSFCATSFSF